jgi:glycosyltransferase involved in cell wall biosynthesis
MEAYSIMSLKKILIAHQSTIPHYRIPFYQEVERLRPDWWDFSVVDDTDESTRRRFFAVPTDHHSLNFKVQHTRTYSMDVKGKLISFQTFPLAARKYDLVVVEDTFNNISNSITHMYRLLGKPVMAWGQGRDVTLVKMSRMKRMMDRIKLHFSKHADGFFAYTSGVQDYLTSHGVDKHKIFVLQNTIDINFQRHIFNKFYQNRHDIKKRMNLEGKKILLYVGRTDRRKKIDILVETYLYLRKIDPNYHLLLVGDFNGAFINTLQRSCGEDAVSFKGLVPDPYDLGNLYVASDLYLFPGDVGLGVIQALCYDLVSAIIESPTNGVEFEYLNPKNCLIAKKDSSIQEYALMIHTFLNDGRKQEQLRSSAWSSIEHLTIENMAKNFIQGINTVLQRKLGCVPTIR